MEEICKEVCARWPLERIEAALEDRGVVLAILRDLYLATKAEEQREAGTLRRGRRERAVPLTPDGVLAYIEEEEVA